MNIKLIASVGALVAAFIAGASIAHTYDSLKYTKEKNAELQAVIDHYKGEIDDLEKTRSRLDADLSSARALSAERLRQLDEWKRRARSGNAEGRECERVLDLAVRGEGLLRRADAMLGALMQ